MSDKMPWEHDWSEDQRAPAESKPAKNPWEHDWSGGEAKSEDQPSKTEAFFEGIAHGAPVIGSYIDNIAAGATKGLAKAHDFLFDTKIDEALGDYPKVRDEMVAETNKIREAHPYVYGGGNVTGAILSGPMIAKALPSTGVSALGRVGQAAGVAGVEGLLMNPGETAGQYGGAQLADRLTNGAIGGVLGGALQGGGELVKAGSDKLRRMAEEKAFKALGPYAREAQQNATKGQINEIGREALESGVVGWRPKSGKGLVASAEGLRDDAGSRVGALTEQIDASGPQGISRKQIAENLRAKLMSGADDIAGVPEKNARILEMIERFENGGADRLGFAEGEGKKRLVDSQINYDRIPGSDIPLEEQFYRMLRGEIASGDVAAAKSVGGTLGDDFVGAKRQYGNASEMARIAKKRDVKNGVNNFLGLSDAGIGAAGAGVGFLSSEGSVEDKLKAAALGGSAALVSKGAKLYGNQILAKGLDAAGKSLGGANKTEYLTSLLQAYRQRKQDVQPGMPGGGGMSPALLQAIQKDPSKLDAIQNPKLKEQLKKMMGRDPSSDEVTHPGPQNEKYINDEEAKQHFIDGN